MITLRFKKLILKHPRNRVLADLLKRDDEEFIRNAYNVILRREADYQGFNHYLSKLRSGQLNKMEILGRLRYSKEGREKDKIIKGLFMHLLIRSFYRIPMRGDTLKFLKRILLFRKVEKHVQNSEGAARVGFWQHSINLEKLAYEVANKANIEMEKYEFDAGSAIDPIGRIFKKEDRIFRGVYGDYKNVVLNALSAAQTNHWFDVGLIPTWEADFTLPDFPLVLEHECRQ